MERTSLLGRCAQVQASNLRLPLLGFCEKWALWFRRKRFSEVDYENRINHTHDIVSLEQLLHFIDTSLDVNQDCSILQTDRELKRTLNLLILCSPTLQNTGFMKKTFVFSVSYYNYIVTLNTLY